MGGFVSRKELRSENGLQLGKRTLRLLLRLGVQPRRCKGFSYAQVAFGHGGGSGHRFDTPDSAGVVHPPKTPKTPAMRRFFAVRRQGLEPRTY